MTDTNNHLRPVSMADSDKTATQSHEPSILEKPAVVESVMPSAAASLHTADPVVADEKNTVNENTSKRNSQASASASDEDDDGFEYPKSWKLAAITIALCLSVFCMALVSHICFHNERFSCLWISG
jgi:hypothetical protein